MVLAGLCLGPVACLPYLGGGPQIGVTTDGELSVGAELGLGFTFAKGDLGYILLPLPESSTVAVDHVAYVALEPAFYASPTLGYAQGQASGGYALFGGSAGLGVTPGYTARDGFDLLHLANIGDCSSGTYSPLVTFTVGYRFYLARSAQENVHEFYFAPKLFAAPCFQISD